MENNSAQAAVPRANVTSIHSVETFVFTVPDLEEAWRFYTTFGLDVRDEGDHIELYSYGNANRWASIYSAPGVKKLQYVQLGIFEKDLDTFRKRIADGTTVQLKVARKVSPDTKAIPTPPPGQLPGKGAAPARSKVQQVRPRRLSHILLFSPDVPEQLRFYTEVLGMRLSDRSGDGIAFMHSPHGSDHHLIALAKSHGPGLHHSSWDVGSVNEVGNGAEQMRDKGYTQGWGVGRHVLGSNYFYYVRDPWGSYAEYSFDIDHIPADIDWQSGDHPPEDSFYMWGPAVPEEFVTNHEAPPVAAAA